jgi:hypothetical protein
MVKRSFADKGVPKYNLGTRQRDTIARRSTATTELILAEFRFRLPFAAKSP